MFDFVTDKEEYKSELAELIKQFDAYSPSDIFSVCLKTENGDSGKIEISVDGSVFKFENDSEIPHDELGRRKITLRFLKNSLYRALKTVLKRDLPWGALTGVRPTKLAYELIEDGTDEEDLPAEMNRIYGVSKGKAMLLKDIIINQKGYYTTDSEYVNLYVHIPLCPSRCRYCSFVSVAADRQKQYIRPYADALSKEILSSAELIYKLGKKVLSVYVGGGTPTVLDAELLDKILSVVPYRGVEYTVEAGRPETVTKEKLDVLARHGVNRISVNPQSLFDETLKSIGRNHTVADFYKAFELTRDYAFTVNVDLIAGLPGETEDMFEDTLDKITALSPENITVHTLSKKRGSEYAESDCILQAETESMMNYAHSKLKENGYVPYYLYRQKQMVGNLENAGYARQGRQSVNNITTMEECVSVVACGAGAISKAVLPQENGGVRIERLANPKDIKLYLEQYDERINKKHLFLKNSLQ